MIGSGSREHREMILLFLSDCTAVVSSIEELIYRKNILCSVWCVCVCERSSWSGLRQLRAEVALAYWNRHSLSGSGRLHRSSWNIVRLVISRRHLSDGQPSCRKSSSFGVNQSAWRRLRATLAYIHSKDIKFSSGREPCHTGLAYSSTGRT